MLRCFQALVILLPLIWPSGAMGNSKKKLGNAVEVPADPVEILTKAESAFQNGEFPTSRELCNRLESKVSTLDPQQKIRFHLLRSRLDFAARNTEGAKGHLEKILVLNPKFELDPLSDPPEALSLLREIKNRANAASNTAPTSAASTPSVQVGDNPDERSALLRKRAGFWSGLLPFGIGHFETGDNRGGMMFLSLDTLSIYVSPFFRGKERYSPRRTEYNNRSRLPNRASEVFFAGSWGYEILGVMPSLMARDNLRANWARHWLSFFPLGVGQMKNGQFGKAVGFGVAQSTLLIYAMTSQNVEQKKTATSILVGTLVYGAFDGWLHHKWINFEPKFAKQDPNWQILPSMMAAPDNAYAPALVIAARIN